MLSHNQPLKTFCKIVPLLVTLVASATATDLKKPRSVEPQQTSSSIPTNAANYVHVTIHPSTGAIVAGAIYSLDAELKNVSNVPVSIDTSHVFLLVQPELAPSNFSCSLSYSAYPINRIPSPVVLHPGDLYMVSFDIGEGASPQILSDSPGCKANFWAKLRKRLDFVPGSFDFRKTGSYKILSTQEPSPAKESALTTATASADSEEHPFTETASLPVAIDQVQIVVYAGLGGLLAFLVMSFRKAATLWEYAGKRAGHSSHFQKIVLIRRAARCCRFYS